MNESLTVTLLGTGTSQGVPVIGCTCPVCLSSDPQDRRLRTSIAIQADGPPIIVDIGPDFRQQMLRAGINDVAAVLLTHEHNDHVSGLDDIRPINFLHKKDISVYGLERVLNELRHRYPYVFDPASDYPGRPRVDLHDIEAGGVLHINGVEVQALHVMHGPLPILGFRIGNFCYITDAKYLSQDVVDNIYGIDNLVINALHRRPHFSHLNLEEALELIERINPGQAYLTHISHDMGLAAAVNIELPERVSLAFDGLQLKAAYTKSSISA